MKVGIDMEEVSRMSKRLLEKIALQSEIDYVSKFKQPLCHIAGLWCAKEAAIKMLGNTKLSFKEIEVVHQKNGQVSIKFYGKAKQVFDDLKLKEASLSISHTKAYAIAIVIAN